MTYFVKDITTAEGITKKAFYVSIGMESFNDGSTVQIRNGIGEFSQQELIDEQTQAQAKVDQFTEMLTYFVV